MTSYMLLLLVGTLAVFGTSVVRAGPAKRAAPENIDIKFTPADQALANSNSHIAKRSGTEVIVEGDLVYYVVTTCSVAFFAVVDRSGTYEGGYMDIFRYLEGNQPSVPTVRTVGQSFPGRPPYPTFFAYFTGFQPCDNVVFNVTMRSADNSKSTQGVFTQQIGCPCDLGSGSGDPHYWTFDDLNLDIIEPCEYILSEECETKEFVVRARQASGSGHRQTKLERLNAEIDNHHIELDERWGCEIDYEHMYGDISITQDYLVIVIRIEGVIGIVTSVENTVFVELDANYSAKIGLLRNVYRNRVCGLLGNDDGNPLNDLMFQNGTLAPGVKEFVEEYKIANSCVF